MVCKGTCTWHIKAKVAQNTLGSTRWMPYQPAKLFKCVLLARP